MLKDVKGLKKKSALFSLTGGFLSLLQQMCTLLVLKLEYLCCDLWLFSFFPNNRQNVLAFIYGWLYQVARELQLPLQFLATVEKCFLKKENGPRFFRNWIICCISQTLSWYTVQFVSMNIWDGNRSRQQPPAFFTDRLECRACRLDASSSCWMNVVPPRRGKYVFRYRQYHRYLCAPITGTNMLHWWAIFFFFNWYKL